MSTEGRPHSGIDFRQDRAGSPSLRAMLDAIAPATIGARQSGDLHQDRSATSPARAARVSPLARLADHQAAGTGDEKLAEGTPTAPRARRLVRSLLVPTLLGTAVLALYLTADPGKDELAAMLAQRTKAMTTAGAVSRTAPMVVAALMPDRVGRFANVHLAAASRDVAADASAPPLRTPAPAAAPAPVTTVALAQPAAPPPQPRIRLATLIEAAPGATVSFPLRIDGIEHVSPHAVLVIKGIPELSGLSKGRPIEPGTWTIDPQAASGLDLTFYAMPHRQTDVSVELLDPNGRLIAEAHTRITRADTTTVATAAPLPVHRTAPMQMSVVTTRMPMQPPATAPAEKPAIRKAQAGEHRAKPRQPRIAAARTAPRPAPAPAQAPAPAIAPGVLPPLGGSGPTPLLPPMPPPSTAQSDGDMPAWAKPWARSALGAVVSQ